MHRPELMSVAAFCADHSIGRTSFYREVKAGRLHIVKFGTATRITRDEAAKWRASLADREGVQS